MTPAPAERTFTLDFAPDLRATLGELALGRRDPTMTLDTTGLWRASRTPEGPATLHLRADGPTVAARAWGPGAGWLLDHAPAWVGALDDVSGFDPSAHPVVAAASRRRPGLRVARTARVLERLVPSILGQKVTGLEAKRSWHGLVRLAGEPAPGPAGLLVPPEATWLARLPDHAYHRLGVERKRADAIRAAARVANRLEEAVDLGADVLRTRLLAVRGIGPWTAAEVGAIAAGDADAVSVGDFHLPNLVAWNLAGEPRADDARMLELLAPFAGHRGRVARLLELTGTAAPRYGPRLAPRSFAAM